MKNRRLTIFLLSIVNFLLLIVTVVPHHHHDGVPCIRILTQEQMEHHGNADTDSDHCADDCITKFEFRETSQQDQQTMAEAFVLVPIELFIPDFSDPDTGVKVLFVPDHDPFHSFLIISSQGLRAPPALVG